ncbi:hypothetical protein BN2476_990035 [Paraburkholderia piptadeniae]|uniref:Uncharacterized protein n=1 Tax=Paraburkholderia piptadeniae TaxID=1701573 RepID=A0A1N7SUH9_9BURK|nr:hypothetical protein BN2476_990035 [Paraburkholderia piptadeniae]
MPIGGAVATSGKRWPGQRPRRPGPRTEEIHSISMPDVFSAGSIDADFSGIGETEDYAW